MMILDGHIANGQNATIFAYGVTGSGKTHVSECHTRGRTLLTGCKDDARDDRPAGAHIPDYRSESNSSFLLQCWPFPD